MSPNLRALLQRQLGFLPGAMAVMGKWEPFMRASRCLEEVAARAAAALAISEVLEPAGPQPYYLSAEAQLRGQRRPGCLLAAEILMELGARTDRIRCCPASNCTVTELQILERMGYQLGVEGLLLLTASYHIQRTRHLLQRNVPRLIPMGVMACEDSAVKLALDQLSPQRRQHLARVIQQGSRAGMSRVPVALNETIARLGELWPGIERFVADWVRGPVDVKASPMFCPTGLDHDPARLNHE